MKTLETIGYQGGKMFLAANRIVGFQRRKNPGDMTETGITPVAQTTIWMAGDTESETWTVLESVEDIKRKYDAL